MVVAVSHSVMAQHTRGFMPPIMHLMISRKKRKKKSWWLPGTLQWLHFFFDQFFALKTKKIYVKKEEGDIHKVTNFCSMKETKKRKRERGGKKYSVTKSVIAV